MLVNRARTSFCPDVGAPRTSGQKEKLAGWKGKGVGPHCFYRCHYSKAEAAEVLGGVAASVTETFTRGIYNGLASIVGGVERENAKKAHCRAAACKFPQYCESQYFVAFSRATLELAGSGLEFPVLINVESLSVILLDGRRLHWFLGEENCKRSQMVIECFAEHLLSNESFSERSREMFCLSSLAFDSGHSRVSAFPRSLVHIDPHMETWFELFSLLGE